MELLHSGERRNDTSKYFWRICCQTNAILALHISMFSAPLADHLETAFELPGYLQSPRTMHGGGQRVFGRDVGSFISGIAFDKDGRLWVSDTPFGRIFRVTPTGEWDFDLAIRRMAGGVGISCGWPIDHCRPAPRFAGTRHRNAKRFALGHALPLAAVPRCVWPHVCHERRLLFSDRGQSGSMIAAVPSIAWKSMAR